MHVADKPATDSSSKNNKFEDTLGRLRGGGNVSGDSNTKDEDAEEVPEALQQQPQRAAGDYGSFFKRVAKRLTKKGGQQVTYKKIIKFSMIARLLLVSLAFVLVLYFCVLHGFPFSVRNTVILVSVSTSALLD